MHDIRGGSTLGETLLPYSSVAGFGHRCVVGAIQGLGASLDSVDRLRADQREIGDRQGVRDSMLSHVCDPTDIKGNDAALV